MDSLDSALAAKEGGATRLELCANLLIGGTTPMPSLVRRVKAATACPPTPCCAPRFGDFLYTGEEFSLLLEDAAALLEAGADAIVSGFLTPAGGLGPAAPGPAGELCHRAGKRFTLHRAFDMCRDPFAALELCKELGVDTVLTSGQKNTCLEGLPLLEELWPRRGGVELLLGGGHQRRGHPADTGEPAPGQGFPHERQNHRGEPHVLPQGGRVHGPARL